MVVAQDETIILKFPDTNNVFSVVFQPTIDATTGRKVNPSRRVSFGEEFAAPRHSGPAARARLRQEINRSFDQNIKCNCTGDAGSRKRKYKNDDGKLADLMGRSWASPRRRASDRDSGAERE